jgi:hypothetical protein
MVLCGRMWPMLLMTKAVNTRNRLTMGKGVAVRTVSEGGTRGRRRGEEEISSGPSPHSLDLHVSLPPLVPLVPPLSQGPPLSLILPLLIPPSPHHTPWLDSTPFMWTPPSQAPP